MTVDPRAVVNNRLISIGFAAVTGSMSVDEAVEAVTNPQLLTAYTDADLRDLIEEAAEWAIDRHTDYAGYGLIWQRLCLECAQAQVRRLGEARHRAPQQVSDELFSAWIGFASWQAISYGYWAILGPDLREAYAILQDAELLARGLPDLDLPRFFEIAAALYGQVRVANLGGHPEYAALPGLHLDEVLAAPGWHTKDADQQRFVALFDQVIRAREADGSQRENLAPEAEHSSAETDALDYYAAVAELASTMSERDAVVDRAREITRPAMSEANEEMVTNLMGSVLADTPATALRMARIHHAATEMTNQDVTSPARALAAFALGRAQIKCALIGGDQFGQDLFAEAALVLEQCIPGLTHHRYDEASAMAQRYLGMALRGQGRMAEAHTAYLEAAERLEALPDGRNKRIELASALGNLADTYEHLGQPARALDLLIRAHENFLQDGDVRLALQALGNMWRLAYAVGRGDEAANAALASLHLMESVANLQEAAQAAVRLAEFAITYRQLDIAYTLLDSAGAFLGTEDAEPDRDQKWYSLCSEVLLWQGVVTYMIANAEDPPSAEYVSLAADFATRSRDAAAHAGNSFRRASAEVFEVWCALLAGDRPSADRKLRELLTDGFPPRLTAQVETLMGRLAESPEDAARHLNRAIEGFTQAGRPDQAAATLTSLADLLERDGDVESALVALEDAHQMLSKLRGALARDDSRVGLRGQFESLYDHAVVLSCRRDDGRTWAWTERAKSRATVELMALSPIPLDPTTLPPEAVILLAEENQLIDQIRSARFTDLATLYPDSSRELNAAVDAHDQLRDIWDQLRHLLPEYVSLRTGEVREWTEVQAVLDS
ncbi:tetratricopeptide repeat protein [Kribbella sp. NPDC026611]|uniref:tetratricopeptide repeat protein n=1 Tax=Kribbella sp. NPDC026611 TaxID=3154911 RepID=UPI0033DBAFBA